MKELFGAYPRIVLDFGGEIALEGLSLTPALSRPPSPGFGATGWERENCTPMFDIMGDGIGSQSQCMRESTEAAKNNVWPGCLWG